MTSERRFMLRGSVLLGVATAVVIWASAEAAMAQDKSAPAKQDAKAQDATKTKQGAAGPNPDVVRNRLIQRPTLTLPQKPVAPARRAVGSKVRNAAPKPTVVLKAGEVPNISFDTPNYNFGRVRAGQPIKHDFWFTNTGTGPLEILRVKPS